MELELSTDLIEIKQGNALDFFTTPAKVDEILVSLRARAHKEQEMIADPFSESGRAAIKSLAFKIAKSKTALENVGEQLAREQKEIPKRIDAGRKRIKDYLDGLRDEVRRPVTEWEETEEARKQAHLARIDSLKGYVASIETDAETIRGLLAAAEAIEVSPEKCEEFEDGYRLAKQNAVGGLTTALAARVKYETDQAELSALREKQRIADEAEAERLRLQRIREREEQVAREAADKASADARRVAQAEIDAANARTTDAERRAREESDRIAAEASAEASRKAQEAEEARRREASRLHRQKVGAEAAAALMLKVEGLTEKMALDVVRAIAKKEIPRLEVIW